MEYFIRTTLCLILAGCFLVQSTDSAACKPPPQSRLTVTELIPGEVVFTLSNKTVEGEPLVWRIFSAQLVSTHVDVSSYLKIGHVAGQPVVKWVDDPNKMAALKSLGTLYIGVDVKCETENMFDGEGFMFPVIILLTESAKDVEDVSKTIDVDVTVRENLKVGSELYNLESLREEINTADRVIAPQEVGFAESVPESPGYFTWTAVGTLILTNNFQDGHVDRYAVGTMLKTGHRVVLNIFVDRKNTVPVFWKKGCTLGPQVCAVTLYEATVHPNYTGEITDVRPTHVSAFDAEGDDIYYKLSSDNPRIVTEIFSIHIRRGVVSLNENLDLGSEYNIYIQVADSVVTFPNVTYNEVLFKVKVEEDNNELQEDFEASDENQSLSTTPHAERRDDSVEIDGYLEPNMELAKIEKENNFGIVLSLNLPLLATTLIVTLWI